MSDPMRWPDPEAQRPDPDDVPTCKTAAETLAEIEKEIAWNERRLQNLVLSDKDRHQTEDMVADLRQERQQFLAILGKAKDGY